MADTHTDWRRTASDHPCFRTRVNVGRTATAVVFDATIEATWSGTPGSYYLDGTEHSIDAALDEISARVRNDIAARVHEAKAVDTYVPKPGK